MSHDGCIHFGYQGDGERAGIAQAGEDELWVVVGMCSMQKRGLCDGGNCGNVVW